MATLLEEDLSALPFLKKALDANAERYPSIQNGLNTMQQLILELIGRRRGTRSVVISKSKQNGQSIMASVICSSGLLWIVSANVRFRWSVLPEGTSCRVTVSSCLLNLINGDCIGLKWEN